MNFGQLSRHKHISSGKMVYYWLVDGAKLTFVTEKKLMSQDEFRAQCIQKLKFLPKKMRQEDWVGEINKALSSVVDE